MTSVLPIRVLESATDKSLRISGMMMASFANDAWGDIKEHAISEDESGAPGGF